MAEDDDPIDDWGDADETISDEAVPTALVVREPTTAPHPVQELPGFEPGYVLGKRRGIAEAMEALRVDLIQKGGIDPGVAAIAAETWAAGAACGITDPR